ncbi:hypothetical protein [Aeromonas salmonicida]|jgi:phage-related minor tail protein|uniref:hypothetical protein n=1 Tax=Aeromonas salmonicida TaxID=645 RepID=UPI00240D881C|nr:hypothetical protein [Aeromonas salmonicida]WFC12674.1 hypothetical protein L3V47_13040 [Aeromonas salmonicida]
MSTLGNEFQKTVFNLEAIRDSQEPASFDVLEKLDKLYAQQIDLIDAAIKKETDEYVSATMSMGEAAKITQEAIDNLAKLEEAIKKVANAIGKVGLLLVAVT